MKLNETVKEYNTNISSSKKKKSQADFKNFHRHSKHCSPN
jgi:hypothetical protein